MMGNKDDLTLAKELKDGRDKILKEIRKIIVGQDAVINDILIALLSRGHILLVGVPGLAKTLVVKTLASILDLTFKRIQFTPDLMPSDIIGIDVIEENPVTKSRDFKFIKGPVFGNIILADEINRTPPKTQSALLEAMQEYKVTAGGITYPLDLPFMVLATQNPIEQEGTYPLPEAQQDRFMFNTYITYPSSEEMKEILKKTTADYTPSFEKTLSAKDIMSYNEIVRKVPVADVVMDYVIELVSCTRPDYANSPEFIKKWVQWGAGPRAAQYLTLGGKASAILNGSTYVSRENVDSIALQTLRHRIILNYVAEAEGVNVNDVIKKLIEYMKTRSL